MATVINGTTGVSKVQDGSIYPEDLVQKMTLMTAQTASGTSVDFTGIPSWANRITVMFNGVSTNGTSPVQIQLGDSGVVETTGYTSIGNTLGLNISTSTTGLITSYTRAAVDIMYATAVITKTNTSVFSMVCNGNYTNALYGILASGSKTLSGTLYRIRITTVNGTDVFDAGTINIMYEG